MSDYIAEMNAYADRVASMVDGSDIQVIAATAIHDGWDDGVIIACGETKGTIIVRLASGREMAIEPQLKGLVPALRRKEAERIAENKAIDESFARFYV